MTSRRIPLRRSDADTTRGTKTHSLYRLVEEKLVQGDVVADHLDENEMMCVQMPISSAIPMLCTCWIGPLENAGLQGEGFHAMRKVVILSGSVEEAALALIENWAADIGASNGRDPCSTERLTVSYDGGVFKPEP